ncbi:hypothetical protein PQR72_07075 [Paraburkholderia madseniana]|uniref:hypothetical protein n=1 Tax=Paraburkholderia madseniana TaxID=2599607 RepID=UPI0038B813C4
MVQRKRGGVFFKFAALLATLNRSAIGGATTIAGIRLMDVAPSLDLGARHASFADSRSLAARQSRFAVYNSAAPDFCPILP